MANDKLAKYIDSKSTVELADMLAEQLKQYRAAVMQPDATLSIPNLEMMCAVAEAIAERLKT